MKKLFVLGILALLGEFASAQNGLGQYLDSNGWYLFLDNEASLTVSQVITSRADLGLTADDSLHVHQEVHDSTGGHFRFKQFYRGYEVEDAQFVLHTAGNLADLATGNLVAGLNLNTNNPVSENDAFQAATAAIGASEYSWQNASQQEAYQALVDDSTAVLAPSAGRLVIGRKLHGGFAASDYVFAWRFVVETTAPEHRILKVLVDAQTGNTVDVADDGQASYCNNGTVLTNYYGWKTDLETTSCTFCSNWRLQDCRKIQTQQDDVILKDGDNTWSDPGERGATSTHWIAGRVWDYFKQYWGCNGSDGNFGNLTIKKYTANNSNTSTSFVPSINTMYVYNASNGNPHSTYDIIAHEFTHGTTYRTSGLIYEKESGALNESFSDIFGKTFERYMKGSGLGWGIGADCGVSVRDMANPPSHQHPDTYGGAYWYNTSGCVPDKNANDNCGVHTNSGVQNKWFYLLVDAIGFDKAAMIAWYNLNLYLKPNSGYVDAKMGAITAAKQLYGDCSTEAYETIVAWRRVGVETGVSGLHRQCYHDAVYGSIQPVHPEPGRLAPPVQNVRIFPNPTSGAVRIWLPDNALGATVQVRSALGQLVLQTTVSTNRSDLDLSFLPAGAYEVWISKRDFDYREKILLTQ